MTKLRDFDVRSNFLQFSPPTIGEEEIAEVVDSLRSGWITTGPKVRRFENEFASYVGAEAALAVFSGTDAMLVALAALGVKAGDEVITTAMTFCSTVHVIEHTGAKPILVDVEDDTLNIDPTMVEKAMCPRTKGILPVHLYGHPCELNDLRFLAEKRDLFLLEDAAHAIPAKYGGKMVGSAGSTAAFSFYATKNMTTAEGGMLVGNRELIQLARMWSLHGMSCDAYKRYSADGSWYYEVVLPGFKCNMTDIQAAIGIHQLKKLPNFHKRRKEIVTHYNQAFSQIPEIETPVERLCVESAWHLYVIRLNLEMLTIDRNRFIEELRLRKIGTSVHFISIHLHPYYRDKYGYKPADFPVAFRNYQRIISLPLHPRLSDKDIDDVIEAVADVIEKFRR
jgi:dTDP-4-amino-4,6-dideoxygalactose transaminase